MSSAAFVKESLLTASVFDSISAIGSDHGSNMGNSTAQGNAVPASTAPAASVKVKTKAKEAESIKFFNTLEIDYISCSPFRIPTAKLAAAQAEIIQSN